MKASGAEILACYNDDAFFAGWKDWYIELGDHADNEGEPALEPDAAYTVEDLCWTLGWQGDQEPPLRAPWGVKVDVMSDRRGEVSFASSFRVWKKQRTHVVYVVEVPNEEVSAFEAWMKEHKVRKAKGD